MREFFAPSPYLIELRALQEKMSILHIRIPSQKARYEEENRQIEFYKDQVNEARLRLENLEKERDRNEDQCNEAEEKTGRLQLEAQSIEAEYRQVCEEVKKTSAEREKIQIQLRQLNERLEEIKKEIESVTEEINQLNLIIHKNAPNTRYETDGLYCENGIYMCTNHPPRRVLANGAEIAAHKKAVAEATTRKNQLGIEKNYLREKRDRFQADIKRAEINLRKTIEDHLKFQNKENSLKRSLTENQQELEGVKKDHELLLEEKNELNRKIEHTLDKLRGLLANAVLAECRAEDAKNHWLSSEAELDFLKEQAQQIQQQIDLAKAQQITPNELTQIAEREIAQEEKDILTRLAEAELAAEERAHESSSSSDNKFADGFKHMADDLREAGRELKQLGDDIMTTASDVYSPLAGTLMKSIFDGPKGINRDFSEGPPEHTGNMIIDHANSP